MGFWSGLFSGLTGGGNYQVPPPPSAHQTYQQLINSGQVSSSYANAQLSAMSRTGGLMGTHMSGTPEMYRIDQEVYKLTNYAEMCGDTVEMVDLPIGEETDDVKVAILKAADAGKYVKNVGIKIADNRFAVYREQGE